MRTERTLVLSTAHMPAAKPFFGCVRSVEHEYGFVVFMPVDNPQLAGWPPKWLQPIIEIARSLACSFIVFDRDAETYHALRTWDW